MGCGCGLIGSPIISTGSTAPVYSKPSRRQGESGVFSIEVLAVNAPFGVDISVEHRDETGSWSVLATTAVPITATGVVTFALSAVKQLYRIAINFHGGTTAGESVLTANAGVSAFPY